MEKKYRFKIKLPKLSPTKWRHICEKGWYQLPSEFAGATIKTMPNGSQFTLIGGEWHQILTGSGEPLHVR